MSSRRYRIRNFFFEIFAIGDVNFDLFDMIRFGYGLQAFRGVVALKVIHYPHPTLRRKAKPVKRVDANLKNIIANMFELMYQQKGVGLAANQVDIPLQFFVVNPSGKAGEGEELVFINPVLSNPKGRATAEEGCLSIPGLYAQVTRPDQIQVEAYNLNGQAINQTISGHLARIIQHEFDHLQGTLFIDRLSDTERRVCDDDLFEFENEFAAHRAVQLIPGDPQIAQQWEQWEKLYG